MASSRTLSLLEEPILKLFMKLSPAGIVGMLIIGVYNTVDGIFVGRIVGPAGLTAVTLSFPLVLAGSSLSGLVGVGAASLYSRLLGKSDSLRASSVLLLMTILNLVCWAVFFFAFLPFLKPILYFLGADASTIVMAYDYALIVLAGTIFANLMSSANMLIRAEGHMNTAMVIMAVGALLNCVLDPLFMLPLGMGVAGAAWATIISQAVSALLSFLYFFRGKGAVRPILRLGPGTVRESFRILAVGVSAMALPVLNLLQYAIILRAVKIYASSSELAVIGAASRILQMIVIPIWGTSQALQPLAGTNYGAQKYGRVKRAYLVFSLCATGIATILWLLVTLFARQILGWFMSDPVILDHGAVYLRLYLITFPFYGYMMMTLTLFQSTGKALIAALMTLGKFLVFFVPALLVLGPILGARGIFLASPVADVCAIALGSLVLVFQMRRSGYLKTPAAQEKAPEGRGG
jgi:putative MATE family efflux protein